MVALILFGSFFVLLLLNVPIGLSLGVSSILTLLYENLPVSMVSSNLYSSTSKFVLLAIPFFILGGNIMEKSGISQRLIDFCRTLVGHKKSGMAMVCVIVACFFAAISGSGPATVAALGMIIIPAMTRVGYNKASSTALMSTAGAIGIIIPPSITFVIYGSITGNSVGSLFASGIVPGILMGVMLVIAMVWVSRKEELKLLPKATGKEKWAAFKDAFWGLLMPVIILGGIYGGIFTPTEAAAVSAVYGLIVGLFIYKSITLKDIKRLLADSVSQTAVVMFIVGTASLFAWVLTVTGLAASASNMLIQVSGGNKYIFLLIINVILLIAGCFIDANSASYILVPILYPVAISLGIDGVHLGCIMVMNMAIGLITPPVGVNLYVGCGIANVSLKEISKAVLPFVAASIIALLLTTYIPVLSMFLPKLLG
ncbi:TRAP transporter large permease [Lactonifactor longoviformis]|uniref:C4-dicarboxylate transporter, DctM subunit n=1 Tax=Lactonifactor longoviformis DSM 17459 TaxID=1122155 RepID=A0A1M4W3F9_9CLOT|nr:TRAP transporter large permease [Lactonifactor longoviformis]POP32173.1 TRAP transporter large permease [Lactonifactor longoviformis]SHE75756.1 C4-dicarboxylate transporter, DctM subunit [Lactonifactor longoviformis DSM 17459]